MWYIYVGLAIGLSDVVFAFALGHFNKKEYDELCEFVEFDPVALCPPWAIYSTICKTLLWPLCAVHTITIPSPNARRSPNRALSFYSRSEHSVK